MTQCHSNINSHRPITGDCKNFEAPSEFLHGPSAGWA